MKDFIINTWRTFKGYLFASDKWLHLTVGFIIALLVGLIGPIWGLIAGIVAGAGKELYDKISRKGTPELWDLIFTTIGALSAFLCLLLIRLYIYGLIK